MEQKIKNNKGITLIALVLTIIILIILAGISISILTGQDGLITKAKQGAQNYQNSAVEEQAMLNTIGIYTDLNGATNGHGTNVGTAKSDTVHTETKTLTAEDTGVVDLGETHNYRYIDVTNSYEKGKTDGRTVGDGLVTKTVTYTTGNVYVSNTWLEGDFSVTVSDLTTIVGIVSVSQTRKS